MQLGGTPATRAQIEANMAAKMADAAFLEDVLPLLRTALRHDPHEAWHRVHARVIAKLPGSPWKGGGGANTGR